MATSKPVPDLGDVVAKDPQQLQRFLERVREVIQTREGRRGTVLQKGVTYQDLADLGLIARLDSGRYAGVVDAIPGPAGPPGPPGADGGSYTPDLTPPPAAVFVGVTPGFSYLYVEWVQPVYTEGHGHAYTEVWAAQYGGTGPLPTFVDAEIVSRETGNFYAYPAGIEVQVHFWLVNRTNDDVAQVTPTGGTNGEYAMTLGVPIAHLREVLTGEITASQLYTDLATPIGRLGEMEDNAAADALRTALALWDEQNQRATDLLNEAAQRGTDIRTTQTLIDEGDAQLAQQITTLTATVTTNQTAALAAVESAASASASALEAEAEQRNLLAVQMRGNYTGSDLESVVTGLIADERDLRASQTSAAASRLDALEVSVDTPSTGLLARTATLETAVVDLNGDILAEASRIDALEVSVDTPSTGLLARATALEATTTNVTSGNAALASRASALEATVNTPTTGLSARMLTAENTLVSLDGDIGAVATRTTNLEATVDDPTEGVEATYAALQVEESARASQTGHLGAQYSVRATIAGSGGTVAGGFGLSGTSGGTAGPTIDFGVLANTFYVAAPSGSGTAELIPFIVKTTTWDDNGVSRPAGVYIKGAFIENLTAVYATIASLVADDITAADITAAQILAGSLRVGGYLQSTNYVAGTSGWRITAAGVIEGYSATLRGTITATGGAIGGITIDDRSVRSTNFNGTIDASGNVTNVGTAGFALTKAGKLVLDVAHIRDSKTISDVALASPAITGSTTIDVEQAFTQHEGNGFAVLAGCGGTLDLYLNTSADRLLEVGFTIFARETSTLEERWGRTRRISLAATGGFFWSASSTYRYSIPLDASWLFGGDYWRTSKSMPPGMAGTPPSPVQVDNFLDGSGTWRLYLAVTANCYTPGSATLAASISAARLSVGGWKHDLPGSSRYDEPTPPLYV